MQPTGRGEVAEFIRAMALAWKNLAAYPPGHPALRGSVEAAHERLSQMRGPSSEVALGIAADGIVYGDQKIDGAYSQKFAQALYTRGVAVLRLAADTAPKDLEMFLRVLGSNAPDEQSRPIWEQLTGWGVISINLQPVDYSSVKVTSDLDQKPKKQEASSLWDDILRALLAGQELTPATRDRLLRNVHTVDELAAMIVRYIDHPGELLESEFDPDATFGVKFTSRVPDVTETPASMALRVAEAIGKHVAGSSGLRRQLAVQQIVQLLRGLPDALRAAVIRNVLRTLATDEASGSLLRDLSMSASAREILDGLRYVNSISRLSSHAALMLQSLIQTTTPSARESSPSPAIVAELAQLFGDEDIDRFNPPDHRDLLNEVTVRMPETPPASAEARRLIVERLGSVADDVVDRLLARTLLEMVSRHGATRDPKPLLNRLESIFRTFLGSGEFRDAQRLIEDSQELALTTADVNLRTAIEEFLQRLANPETIKALISSLVSATPEQAAAMQPLVHALGTAATRTLLISLAEENNRSRRRKLFDFVTSLGTIVVPEARSFLTDSRWYVVRNMILLLRAANDRTTLPDIRKLAQHPDLRVRLEAIKSLFTLDPSVPRSLLENAINDRDRKAAETAIALVGSYGIREGIEPLLKILEQSDFFGSRRSVRLKALKALGDLGDPSALERLGPFFHDSLLPWRNRVERRAAFESLAGYPADARQPIVTRGLRSRDAGIRAIAEKLAHGGGASQGVER